MAFAVNGTHPSLIYFVFIEIPIWVPVILVITVPVGVCTICILVILKPLNIIGTGQSHKILADVTLRTAKSRTVLHILTSVVGRKSKSIGPAEVFTRRLKLSRLILVFGRISLLRISVKEKRTPVLPVFTLKTAVF